MRVHNKWFGLVTSAVFLVAGSYGLTAAVILATVSGAQAQQYSGPLLPHLGGQVDYAFSNRFGADAEARVTFAGVTSEVLSLQYASTRGLNVQRDVRMSDRETAKSYVLGYSQKMPSMIPGSTSLGISGSALLELRDTGKTSLRLIYDTKLSAIDGVLTLVKKGVKLPLLIEGNTVEVSAVYAKGVFASGKKQGTGEFYFVDNKNNPMLLQSAIQFSWEKEPRVERIVRVAAGESLKSAMEQSLSTLKRYDLYGIHFDFDKATMRPDAASLIKDIALTLKNNPGWTLQINGHTDSIGDPTYNQKLSLARAKSVASAIVNHGIPPDRLMTGGSGSSKPKGDNSTLQGRALNRRVELVRTDK